MATNSITPSTQSRSRLLDNVVVFNARTHNWTFCVEGPGDESTHGKANVDQPWHGIKHQAGSREVNPRKIPRGALIIARRTTRGRGSAPHGTLGLWKYHGYAPVKNQAETPWPETYDYVLYARELNTVEREFQRPFNARFNEDGMFHQTKLMNSVTLLSRTEARAYLGQLSEHTGMSTKAQLFLKKVLGRRQE